MKFGTSFHLCKKNCIKKRDKPDSCFSPKKCILRSGSRNRAILKLDNLVLCRPSYGHFVKMVEWARSLCFYAMPATRISFPQLAAIDQEHLLKANNAPPPRIIEGQCDKGAGVFTRGPLPRAARKICANTNVNGCRSAPLSGIAPNSLLRAGRRREAHGVLERLSGGHFE